MNNNAILLQQGLYDMLSLDVGETETEELNIYGHGCDCPECGSTETTEFQFGESPLHYFGCEDCQKITGVFVNGELDGLDVLTDDDKSLIQWILKVLTRFQNQPTLTPEKALKLSKAKGLLNKLL